MLNFPPAGRLSFLWLNYDTPCLYSHYPPCIFRELVKNNQIIWRVKKKAVPLHRNFWEIR